MLRRTHSVECTEGGMRGLQEVTAQFREAELGGRLVYSLTGSSPIAPEVLAFLRDALQAPMYEAYGSTEAGYVRSWGLINISRFKLQRIITSFHQCWPHCSCSPPASVCQSSWCLFKRVACSAVECCLALHI